MSAILNPKPIIDKRKRGRDRERERAKELEMKVADASIEFRPKNSNRAPSSNQVQFIVMEIR